jgi:DNA repair exonuclease SbcCD ATPase subunit
MSVDSLKAQRRSAKSEKSTLTKRHDKLRKIVASIDEKMDDDVRDINKQLEKCTSNLRDGIRGYSRNQTVANSIDDIKEKNVAYETKMSSCRNNLTSEMQRCQTRIDELSRQISTLEYQIKEQGGTIYFWE